MSSQMKLSKRNKFHSGVAKAELEPQIFSTLALAERRVDNRKMFKQKLTP